MGRARPAGGVARHQVARSEAVGEVEQEHGACARRGGRRREEWGGGGGEAAAREEVEVGEAACKEGQRGEWVVAERVRVVQDDDGRGGGERGGGQVRAEAYAGRSSRERERPRRRCRRRRRGVGPSPSGRSLLSCFALSLRPSGLVRLTRLLESPFGNQNAYDFREFVHFL